MVWAQNYCLSMHNDGKLISLVVGETDGRMAQDVLRANSLRYSWNIKATMQEQSTNGSYTVSHLLRRGECHRLQALPVMNQLPCG